MYHNLVAPSFLAQLSATFKQQPKAQALVLHDSVWSYEQLDQTANRLQFYFADAGLTRGAVVAIHMQSKATAIAAMIAILREGGVYLPLDPLYPSDRLGYMVANASCHLLVCDNDELLLEGVRRVDVRKLDLTLPIPKLASARLKAESDAYIMYTSGTMGKPKGVRMNHGTLNNLIYWQNQHYVEGECYRTLLFSALSFDVSFQEIFSTLCQGGTLIQLPDEIKNDCRALLTFIDQQDVERLFLPYSALLPLIQLANHLEFYPEGVREWITSGEQLVISEDLRRAFAGMPFARLINQYGPCETHVVTESILSEDPSSWPVQPSIGFPIENAQLWVLDASGRELGPLEEGELWIGGPVLCNGYVNNEEETAKSFELKEINGEFFSVYRTGDLVHKNRYDEYFYKGRADTQVKVGSYRIELCEIEAQLLNSGSVHETAVAVENTEHGSRLVAFMVDGAVPWTDEQHLEHLGKTLPFYMLPNLFIRRATLVKTPSGKVDRKCLLAELQNTVPLTGIQPPFISSEPRDLNANEVAQQVNDDAYLLKDIVPLGLVKEAENTTQPQLELPITVVDMGQSLGPIAIVGIALRVPGAEDVLGFWRNLVAGHELVELVANELNMRGQTRGVLAEPLAFDEEFFAIPAAQAQLMDPQQRLLLELTWQALENAGVVANQIEGRVGIFFGTSKNTYYQARILKNLASQTLYNALIEEQGDENSLSAISFFDALGIENPQFNCAEDDTNSLLAVCQAVEALRTGRCDLALVGSASLNFSEPTDTPTHLCADGHTRPFDVSAAGTVLSDGGAVIVLKRLDQAVADGNHIYACIKGFGVNASDGNAGDKHAQAMALQHQTIEQSFLDAGVTADSMGLVEAHAAASQEDDAIEVAALSQVFRRCTSVEGYCHLGSLKSNLGHLSATAGLASLIKTALCVEQGARVASINFEVPNPALNLSASPFIVTQMFTPWPIPAHERLAGVNALGENGSCAHVVLQGVENAFDDYEGPEYLPFCLSAKSPDALACLVATYGLYLEQNPDKNTHALAAYLLKHRSAFPHRVSLGANRAALLSRAFQEVALDDTDFVAQNWVLAFPGQGSQVLGMGLQLSQKVPEFAQALECCFNLLLADGIDLAAVMWGDSAQALNQTFYTQLALFAIGYSLCETLQALGLPIHSAIGHSIGELVAATCAGVFNLPTALKVVATRGRLMQAQESGAMLAVRRPAGEMVSYLSEGVVIAAINTTDSCTLAGTFAAIEAAGIALKTAGIKCIRLETSHAFHSPSMDAAAKQFATELSGVALKVPAWPFISCVTGEWITDKQAQSIDYWASQLRQPVQFSKGLTALRNLPNLVVIEAGPGRSVCGMVLSDLGQRSDVRRVPLLTQFGDLEVNGFSQALGLLWQYQLPLTWPHLPITPSAFTRLPPYPFARNHHEIEIEVLAPPDLRADIQTVETALIEENITVLQPLNVDFDPVREQLRNTLLLQITVLLSEVTGLDLVGTNPKTQFSQLGLNFVVLTQFINKIRKTYKITLRLSQLLHELASLGALVDYVLELTTEHLEPAFGGGQLNSAAQSPLQTKNNLAPVAGSLVTLVQQQLMVMQLQLKSLAGQLPAATEQSSAPCSLQETYVPTAKNGSVNSDRPFTQTQVNHLAAFSLAYNNQFAASKAFNQAHRPQFADPELVSNFYMALKEMTYPIVVERAEGAYIWDIDGSRLVDISCGQGTNFYGNGAVFIKNALAKQLELGFEMGRQSPLAGQVAALVCEMTGNERTAFCSTTAEAILIAMRLARTVTGKDKIIVFNNHCHGISDELMVIGGASARPAAAGIPDSTIQNVLVLEYGSDNALAYIAEHANEIAALLIEPVQRLNPQLQPKAFLQEARTLCSENDIACIFDEAVTGFRIHPRGAQGYFDVEADLCIYGPILSGGMQLGVISGKRFYMDALDGGQWQFGDNSMPEVGVTQFAAPLMGHPLALAAAMAVVTKMNAEPRWPDWLNARADYMVATINQYANAVGAPLHVENCGSMCKINTPSEVSYADLVTILLRKKGLYLSSQHPVFISTAHSDEDLEYIIQAFKETIDEMVAMGFFPEINIDLTTGEEISIHL